MNPSLLAIDNELMWTVTVAGISIVFGVLLLLVGIFYLFGVVMKKSGGKSGDKKLEKITKTVKKQSPPKAAVAPVAPVIEQGIPGEVVAAISAAIAQLEGGAFTIRSIKRQSTSGRPVWANAGIMDGTRPF